MGREYIFSVVRKRGIIEAAFGFVPALLLLIGMIHWWNDNEEMWKILILAEFFLVAVILVCRGIYRILMPERVIRHGKNPKLLEMADELYENTIYSDEFIDLSENIIAVKSEMPQMAYRWSVFMIEYHDYPNAKVKCFCLHTIDKENILEIDITDTTLTEKKKIIDTILRSCPNAVYSPNGEQSDYLTRMRYSDLNDIPNTPYYKKG